MSNTYTYSAHMHVIFMCTKLASEQFSPEDSGCCSVCDVLPLHAGVLRGDAFVDGACLCCRRNTCPQQGKADGWKMVGKCYVVGSWNSGDNL